VEPSNLGKHSLCDAVGDAAVGPPMFVSRGPDPDDSAMSCCADWTLFTTTWNRAWSTFSNETLPSTAMTLERTSVINCLSSALVGSAMATGREAQTRVGILGGICGVRREGKKIGSEYQMIWRTNDCFIDQRLRDNKAKLNPVRPPKRLWTLGIHSSWLPTNPHLAGLYYAGLKQTYQISKQPNPDLLNYLTN